MSHISTICTSQKVKNTRATQQKSWSCIIFSFEGMCCGGRWGYIHEPLPGCNYHSQSSSFVVLWDNPGSESVTNKNLVYTPTWEMGVFAGWAYSPDSVQTEWIPRTPSVPFLPECQPCLQKTLPPSSTCPNGSLIFSRCFFLIHGGRLSLKFVSSLPGLRPFWS